MWPPGYYVFRDRIPFFLSLIYYFSYLKCPNCHKLLRYLAHCLIDGTTLVLFGSVFLFLTKGSLANIFRISWSYPAPIEYGLFIFIVYRFLFSIGVHEYEAYFIALLSALGSGWLYEIPRWIYTKNVIGIIQPNAVKVFFTDYQLFCLPLVYIIVSYRFKYELPSNLEFVFPSYLIFFVLNFITRMPYFFDALAVNLWSWIVRVPTLLFIGYLLSGIKGAKQ